VRDREQAHLAALGMTVVEREHGRPGLLQPCVQFRDGACGCYASRPQACADYRCELLDEYAAGARTLAECEAVVVELRARLARAEAAMDLPKGGLNADVLYERVRRDQPLGDDDAVVQYLAFAATHFQAPAADLAGLRSLVGRG